MYEKPLFRLCFYGRYIIINTDKSLIGRNLHDKDLGMGEKTKDNAALY